MFLLPSIVVGVFFALLLGGRPSRVLELELRHAWAVPAALALQAVFVTPAAGHIHWPFDAALHLSSYALLIAFAVTNARVLALLPLLLGIAFNAVAIAVNAGKMPVSPAAWHAAGLSDPGGEGNVRMGADHLGFLGDVFALPASFPLANVFSVGDVLIGLGMVVLIVAVSMTDGAERPLIPARLVRPLAVPAFRRLATGKLISHIGDWLTLTALVGWVYEATESTGHVAVLLLVRLAPPILGGGLAAAVVDRLPKARLLVWLELARAATVAGALTAVILNLHALAFGAVAACGLLAAISAATVPALVPSLLDEEYLPAANAGLGIAQDAAMALGALAAGVALSASGALVALAVNCGTFIVAGALYWGIRIGPASVAQDEPGALGLRAGLRYLLRRRLLLVVVGAFGAATIATGLTNATLPRFLDDLGFGAGGYGFGLAALACGLTAGQAVVGFTRVGASGGRWIGAGLVFMAALFITLAFTEHGATAILILALIGLVDGATDVLFDTIVQREADPRYYGRVFGFASVFMTTTMMGAVAAAPLVNGIALPQEVILVAGVSLLAAAAIALVGTGTHVTPRERRGAPASVPVPERR